jgi:3-hydroxyacyl-CoA dehydrogenase/3a,7a,12a-trihydroxy-5b-cholest-24-enoyl-CoA hydratase
MALKTDNTFLMISTFLNSGDGAEAVKKVGATFNFDILASKGGPVAKTWIVDLKNGAGLCKEGKLETPDATFTMTDDDFSDLVAGKLNPQ